MRQIIFFLVFISFNLVAIAQQQPEHKKKMYLSPDGKLYFPKQKPVYFWISDSPDPNSKPVLLKSETTPQYSNPMYFDTEGRNTFRSPSAVDTVTKIVIEPKIDVEFHVYVDNNAPKTILTVNKKDVFEKAGIKYIPDSSKIILESKDDLSGIENIMLAIDNNSFTPYKEPFYPDKEKGYILKYYAYDNTGNTEQIITYRFMVDKTSPVSTLGINGEQFKDILSGNTIIEIKSVDTSSGVSKIHYCIDDTVFRIHNGKINTSALTQGAHVLRYYATDKVGNKEKINSFEFYVDNTPPQVIEEIMGKTYFANGKEFSAGTSMLKISAFDNKAGIKDIYYSINNKNYEKYEKPISLADYKGDMLIKSYAIDNVNNKSVSGLSSNRKNNLPFVDLVAPWLNHKFSGPMFKARDTVFISQRSSMILEAKDEESGIQKIEYQLDSSDLQVYTKPFGISNEGLHSIFMFGYDNTDNLTRQNFSVVVDTTGPIIYERFSTVPVGTNEVNGEKLPVYPDYAVIFLSATDLLSGYEALYYTINNGIMQPYTRDLRNFLPNSTYKIKVRAVDKLGNYTERIIGFIIK